MTDVLPVADARPTRPWLRAVVDVLLVWLVFAADGTWPIPDVNEAHYLTKAKHFWNPEWCSRDLFLESTDSHVAFYWTFGYLTHVMPLPTAALIGRLLQWGLLAWGWRRLSYALVPKFGWAALTGAAMVAFVERGNMAGEWVVGGCEAKVVAYVLLFSALADLIRGRWNFALVQLGGATLFHVLAGGWSLVALGFAWLTAGRDRPPLRTLWPGLILGGLLAWGGLMPAIRVMVVDREFVAPQFNADVVYVYERLSHHLVPERFALEKVLVHLTLWSFWIALALVQRHDGRLRSLRRMICGSGVVALIGLAIALVLPEPSLLGAKLLRFYWFRLSDVMPAIGAALELGVAAATATSSLRRVAMIAVLLVLGGGSLIGVCIERANMPMGRGENLGYASNLEPWRDVCAWIKNNTPKDALVISPRQFYTFKWYAERADVGTWKDIPQNNFWILLWRINLQELYGAEAWINFVPLDKLRSYAKTSGASYVVAYREPPLALKAVYQNNDFVVYELNESNEAR